MGTTTSKTDTKGTRAALAASLAAGAVKHFPAGISLTVGGVSLTLVQIEAQLNGFATLRTNVQTARSALQAKVATEAAQETIMIALIGALVKIIRGTFGNQPDVLA